MAVGIACPECRYLIGVPVPNIEIVKPVAGSNAGIGVLRIAVICPDCEVELSARYTVDVILPELTEGAKRRVNVR